VKRVQEKDVEKSVAQYLNMKKYFVLPQFETCEGRVDIAAFKWKSNYEIDSIGVECKATTNPKAIMKTLREQISNYQKYFPKVYLAIPDGGVNKVIKTLCKSSDVGYIAVMSTKEAKVKLDPPNLNPVFDDSSYCSEVFAKAVMFLSFTSIFGSDVLYSSGRAWISTKGKVGFNLVQEADYADFGVNVEDTRKVLENVNEKNLYSFFKNETLKDARLWVAKEKYFGPGFRTGLTLIHKNVTDVKIRDVAYIFRATRSGDTNLHLGVHKEVWKNWQQLDRKSYEERIRRARDELSPLYRELKGSKIVP